MCAADAEPPCRPAGERASFDSPAAALRAAGAALDYLNATAATLLDGPACGEALVVVGELQAKLTAVHAGLLRRFDAADAHDLDGYGSSSSWLTAKAGMSKGAARAAVRQMRQLSERPLLGQALAAGEITDSVAFTIAERTRKLPAQHASRDRPHPAGGRRRGRLRRRPRHHRRLRDRAVAPAAARPRQPRRRLRRPLGAARVTFGGAAVIRGNLTPECATAVRAVLEALGKKAGPEDNRTEGKRFHDALQMGCTLLLRARLVPDRAGADTQAVVHMSLSQLRQLPGAEALEDAWIRARLGEDGYLTGDDAQAAACDAQTVPVVTGTIDPPVIDKMIGASAGCRLRARDPLSPRGPAGAAARDRPPGHRPGLRPLRDRRRAPAGAAGKTLEHPEPAARHRLLEQHPGAHPPRRPAPRPRTAPGRNAAAPPSTATSTTCATKPTAARPPSPTAPWSVSSIMTSASTAEAGS